MLSVSIKKTYENTWYTLRRCTKKVRYYALFEILHEIITDLSPSPIAVKMRKWSMESWQGIPGKFANTSFLVFPWEWTRLILSGNSFLNWLHLSFFAGCFSFGFTVHDLIRSCRWWKNMKQSHAICKNKQGNQFDDILVGGFNPSEKY